MSAAETKDTFKILLFKIHADKMHKKYLFSHLSNQPNENPDAVA